MMRMLKITEYDCFDFDFVLHHRLHLMSLYQIDSLFLKLNESGLWCVDSSSLVFHQVEREVGVIDRDVCGCGVRGLLLA